MDNGTSNETQRVTFNYSNLAKAAASHHNDDAITRVTVAIEAPVELWGEPGPNGCGFDDAATCWTPTGKTAHQVVAGDSIPIIEYRETPNDDDDRRIYIDAEGTIRERINF